MYHGHIPAVSFSIRGFGGSQRLGGKIDQVVFRSDATGEYSVTMTDRFESQCRLVVEKTSDDIGRYWRTHIRDLLQTSNPGHYLDCYLHYDYLRVGDVSHDQNCSYASMTRIASLHSR